MREYKIDRISAGPSGYSLTFSVYENGCCISSTAVKEGCYFSIYPPDRDLSPREQHDIKHLNARLREVEAKLVSVERKLDLIKGRLGELVSLL